MQLCTMVSDLWIAQEDNILFVEFGNCSNNRPCKQACKASAIIVVFPQLTDKLSFDVFNTKMSRVSAPTLIIHGTKDEIIDFHHGQALYDNAANPVEPLWVEGAGHNDVALYNDYLVRLKTFINKQRTTSTASTISSTSTTSMTSTTSTVFSA